MSSGNHRGLAGLVSSRQIVTLSEAKSLVCTLRTRFLAAKLVPSVAEGTAARHDIVGGFLAPLEMTKGAGLVKP